MNVSEPKGRTNGNGPTPLDAAVLDAYGKYTLPQILGEQAKRLGAGNVAIREKAYGIWQTVNWEEYFSYVRRTALGLLIEDAPSPHGRRSGSQAGLPATTPGTDPK